MLKNYKELHVWQKSYAFCLQIYKGTQKFPNEEKFGLTSQIRRSAISIPSNIAEGYGRRTTADYIRFLYIAYGSLCELETQMMLASDLTYIENRESNSLLTNISDIERMLKSLIKALEAKLSSP